MKIPFALLSLLAATAVFGAMPESQRLHDLDVFQLETADDVQISPDGSKIVYVRVSYDIMTDRARRNLWMVNADGSNNRPLRSESKSFLSPRWSPDGTRLAYVSAAEGSPQLYVRWMDSGQTALLTNLVNAPESITWSPDGRFIAFSALVPSDKKPLAAPPPRPEGAQWAPPVKIIDSVVYRADGADRRVYAAVDNFLYALCIPGALAALLFPTWTKLPFWNFMHLHSFSVHVLLFVIPLMLTIGGDIKPDIKQIPKCLLLLLCMGLVAKGANLLWRTNFMFLESASEGNPLYIFEQKFGNHLIGLPVLAAAVLAVMYGPLTVLQKCRGRKHKNI
jgi:hypothetical protein